MLVISYLMSKKRLILQVNLDLYMLLTLYISILLRIYSNILLHTISQ